MGPSLAARLHRAIAAAGGANRVTAVSRFRSPLAEDTLRNSGVATIACDLMDADAVAALPQTPNVIFMAGRKFGSTGSPDATWAANTMVPAHVVRRFRESRIVVFSTGNVYPFVTPFAGGSTESDEPAPRGEYAQSCLGRERIFEFASREYGTRCLLFRLNYAVDLRYGVLVDIALRVHQGLPVDLSVPAVNTIWQGDANSYAIRSLDLCAAPAARLNVTGPETIAVARAAGFFAARFGRPAHFSGEPSPTALLSHAALCHEKLGYPEVPLGRLMEWVAAWIERGGPLLDAPTKFQVKDGRF
jgi:nucleoside-diphosphate-sugar epimerase